jgi:hypothetical protein
MPAVELGTPLQEFHDGRGFSVGSVEEGDTPRTSGVGFSVGSFSGLLCLKPEIHRVDPEFRSTLRLL